MSTDTIKERPILYSGAMVRARMEGRKTQTRRVCMARTQNQADIVAYAIQQDMAGSDDGSNERAAWERIGCPYGQPGDRLWVQENHRLWVDDDAKREVLVRYEADGVVKRRALTEDEWAKLKGRKNRVPALPFNAGLPLDDATWQRTRLIPGRFMFRSLSRGLDEVISVCIERLQDISERDALAEGVTICGMDAVDAMIESREPAQIAYEELWEAINGPGSWAANPFVWVVEFKRIPFVGQLANLKRPCHDTCCCPTCCPEGIAP